MLNINEARVLADNKCIELFGKEFCEKYAEFSGSSYEVKDKVLTATYGMNDEIQNSSSKLRLTEVKYKYMLVINVDRDSGEISIEKSVLPQC